MKSSSIRTITTKKTIYYDPATSQIKNVVQETTYSTDGGDSRRASKAMESEQQYEQSLQDTQINWPAETPSRVPKLQSAPIVCSPPANIKMQRGDETPRQYYGQQMQAPAIERNVEVPSRAPRVESSPVYYAPSQSNIITSPANFAPNKQMQGGDNKAFRAPIRSETQTEPPFQGRAADFDSRGQMRRESMPAYFTPVPATTPRSSLNVDGKMFKPVREDEIYEPPQFQGPAMGGAAQLVSRTPIVQPAPFYPASSKSTTSVQNERPQRGEGTRDYKTSETAKPPKQQNAPPLQGAPMGRSAKVPPPSSSVSSQNFQPSGKTQDQSSKSSKPSKKKEALVPQSNYDAIKAECLRMGQLWEDPDFPAVMSSIYSREQQSRSFEWKRPHDVCDNPMFVSGGVSRFDVVQGELGDCWLLAAIANITLNDDLVKRIIPMDHPQNFDKGNYCGAFRFNFWYYGKWKEIVVDDRLPTSNGRLVFMHSAEQNEFWSALLEKAYAKLVGSYENLKGGSTTEAMTDFTGGFSESIELREKAPKSLLQIMLKASERGSLMGCSVNQQGGFQTEAKLSNGLVMGHAYSITAVKQITLKKAGNSKIGLLRIRNPWGNTAEWNGAWSDNSKEWSLLTDDERKEMGITFDADGEFWMSFQDFVTNFECLEICHISLDSVTDDDVNKEKKRFKWENTLIDGEWRRRVNAGGCINYRDSFWTNPQYRVTVEDPDENDDEDKCTVLIGVLQKDRRKHRSEGFEYLTIGFALYKLKDPNCGPLDQSFFRQNASVAKSTFIDLREVSGRFKLPPGHYVVIPSTFEPGQDAEFVARIYTEKPNTSGEIDEETAIDMEAVASRPPPTASEKKALDEAHKLFTEISGDDGAVDAYEFLQILNEMFTKEFKCPPFSLETARSMVALKDEDMSAKLEEEEFAELWDELRALRKSFVEFDKDNSGSLQSIELREALNASGFRLSNQTFKALVMRYSDRQGNLTFDNYICCALRLKAMIDKFRKSAANSKDSRATASMPLDDFILTTMYC